MLKKFVVLIFNIFCYIIFLNCIVASAKEGDKILVTTSPENKIDSNSENSTKDKNNKIEIEFTDYYTNYNGYIDQVAMFDNKYDNQDYDGDGLYDRIYRKVFDVVRKNGIKGSNSSYRIDFGNGDKLEIGNLDDVFTGIQIIGYDLTGDGVNEIIFCGKHKATTFPPSGSEIAVYQKKDNGYEMMPLPRQDAWSGEDKFEIGYSFYKTNMKDNEVTIYSPKLNYKETIILDGYDEPNIYNAFDSFKEASYDETITEPAWRVDVIEYNGKPTLVIYDHIDSRYYDKDVAAYLQWLDGLFTPVKEEIVPSQEDNNTE